MNAQEQRRLLELAAKAKGITVRWHEKSLYGPTMEIMDDESGGPPWNPIDDDGDALRLAVTLGMDVDVCLETNSTWALAAYDGSPGITENHRESDPYAATRLAIVRAAAAIGEEMEEER